MDIEIVSGKPPVTVEEIARRIEAHLRGTGVLRAILFGSFATGRADVASDVDLVVVEPTELPFVERGRRHLPLFRLGVGLDLLVYTPEEYERLRQAGHPLIERVEREGITVYYDPAAEARRWLDQAEFRPQAPPALALTDPGFGVW